ncbi:ADP-ribosylglycohydrolase family protein [Phaeacidiphilus oryzae]|jgi:ADP-ribosylglycohydrolase|uniref:ADP-ribosylglycohydrolase family protein n=1 Tax=Phaeacidiphilus oryzae TaxID=348818 RepID=UPI00056CADD2|nr:ADP-ribosylglycohydrolase family protein [Phaeacidiphilus oryzae]
MQLWSRAQQQDFRSRVRGCLLGGAIGDALGAGVEFAALADIRAKHGPRGVEDFVRSYGRVGAITDDTQMTLFTVEGLIRAHVRRDTGGWHPPTDLHRAYRRWEQTQREWGPDERREEQGWLARQEWLYAQRAPGNACLTGLADDVMGTLEKPKNPGSKGCGTVMRSAPFGLLAGWEPALVFQIAIEAAVLTHGHPTGYLSAAAFAVIVHTVVRGGTLEDGVQTALRMLAERPDHEETTRALERALEEVRAGEPSAERVERLGQGWIAEEALSIGVYCALVAEDVRSGLLLAVNHSGDSDSTGSVCGNLLGAVHGETALPGEWLAQLEGRETISVLADDFAMEMTHGPELHGPRRPPNAWTKRYPPTV